MMIFLEQQGHEVKVLTSNYIKKDEKEANINRSMHLIDYANGSILNKSFVEHHNYKITEKLIKDFKPDIIYFWSLRGIGLSVIEASEKYKIPKIFEIGDFWMKGFIHHNLQSSIKLKSKPYSRIHILKK
jgi:hypothetical protein